MFAAFLLTKLFNAVSQQLKREMIRFYDPVTFES